MPIKAQDIVNQNTNQKQEKLNSVSELLSIMTAIQDYLNLQMIINFSEDIKLHLKNYLQGVSAFLSISKYGNHEQISKMFKITFNYLQDQLRLLNLLKDKLSQVPAKETGQDKLELWRQVKIKVEQEVQNRVLIFDRIP